MKRYIICVVALVILGMAGYVIVSGQPAEVTKASSVTGHPIKGMSNNGAHSSFSISGSGTLVFVTDNPDPKVKVDGTTVSVEALGDPLNDDSGNYRFAITVNGSASVSVGKGKYLAYTFLR